MAESHVDTQISTLNSHYVIWMICCFICRTGGYYSGCAFGSLCTTTNTVCHCVHSQTAESLKSSAQKKKISKAAGLPKNTASLYQGNPF